MGLYGVYIFYGVYITYTSAVAHEVYMRHSNGGFLRKRWAIMTRRERVKQAISLSQPDMVPYHFDFTVPARQKMVKHFGTEALDDVLGNHLAFIKALPPDAFCEVKPGFIRDEWGVTWNRTVDKDIGVPDAPLAEPNLDGWRFPDPFDKRRFERFPAFTEQHEDQFIILKMSYSLFERAWSLRGMENLLTDMILRPNFVDELLDRIMEFNLAIIGQAANYEIDGVYFGDDWGQQVGLIMGPKLWRRFIKPRLERMYARVKEIGRAVFIHSCGDIEEILPELIEIGLNVFNPFQPEVMDVFKVKKEYGDRLAFYGGISIQRTLPFGTPDEVREVARRMIREIGRGGGYILSPAHAVPGDVPVANILALLDVVQNQ